MNTIWFNVVFYARQHDTKKDSDQINTIDVFHMCTEQDLWSPFWLLGQDTELPLYQVTFNASQIKCVSFVFFSKFIAGQKKLISQNPDFSTKFLKLEFQK